MRIFVIVILLFVFTIEPSIYWAIINAQIDALDDIEISKQAILIFSSSQYLSIFLLLLVSYIAFKKIIEKIEEVKTDPKVISKYLTFTVLWLAIATMPIIWGLVYMFQQLAI
jgi:amino acid transporter